MCVIHVTVHVRLGAERFVTHGARPPSGLGVAVVVRDVPREVLAVLQGFGAQRTGQPGQP